MSCSYLDAAERSPKPGSLPGKVIETSLTDDEIAERGGSVVYRFRSAPNLVYVRDFDSDRRAVRISQSKTLQDLTERYRKQDLVDTVPRGPNLFFSATEEHGYAYEEAGFAEAAKLINSSGQSLNSVRVAIVDSGIVPATSRIQKAFIGNINLTGEADLCGWQDHATAIASLFVGPVDESLSGGPCVSTISTGSGLTAASSYSPSAATPLAPNVELFGVKISFDSDGKNSLRKDLGSLQLAVALDAAVANGARLVNLSFSYARMEPEEEVRDTERFIFANAATKGVVFVAAAGNSGWNIDKKSVYPPKYSLQNLLVVGSHTATLRRSEDSNYGTSVDVTAQGVSIPANAPNGTVKLFTGTSFSTPIVVAALAWYLGADSEANSAEMVQDLFSSSIPAYQQYGSPVENVSRYGRLNVSELMKLGMKRKMARAATNH